MAVKSSSFYGTVTSDLGENQLRDAGFKKERTGAKSFSETKSDTLHVNTADEESHISKDEQDESLHRPLSGLQDKTVSLTVEEDQSTTVTLKKSKSQKKEKKKLKKDLKRELKEQERREKEEKKERKRREKEERDREIREKRER